MLAIEPVSVIDLTAPTIFVGTANVVVLVTSPFAFVVTPGRAEAVGDTDGVAVGTALAEGLGEADGVGVAVTVGNADADGEGDGDTEGAGPGPAPPPNPPPENPPPLFPFEPPPLSFVEPAIIEKVRGTDVAAAYEEFPDCAAVIVQEPGFTKVTRLLVMLQLPDAVNVTDRPEVLEAETVNGPGIVLFVIAANVIV